MSLPKSLSVLQHRDFRLYWFGQSISLIGTWMQSLGQQWVVTSLSSSAFVLGFLHIIASLPILLFSLQGGVLADRLEKRRILLLTQSAMMCLAFLFAAFLFSNILVLWHVFLFACLLGVANAFDRPSMHALTPELVDTKQIPKAVALMQASFHGARLLGPALAGILILQWGEASTFFLNGFSFLAVLICLLLIRREKPQQVPQGKNSIREGFSYIKKQPWAIACLAITGLTTTLVFPFIVVLMVYYIRYVLESNAQQMGIMMSASGFGSLIGALFLILTTSKTRSFRLIEGMLGSALSLFFLSISVSFWPSVFLVVCLTFSVSSLLGTISQTLQERVRKELRGRVMSIYSIAFSGLLPISALFLSWLSDQIGLLVLMQICSVVYLVFSLVLLHQYRNSFLKE